MAVSVKRDRQSISWSTFLCYSHTYTCRCSRRLRWCYPLYPHSFQLCSDILKWIVYEDGQCIYHVFKYTTEAQEWSRLCPTQTS